ncbi:MAG: transcription-repair coupling factor (superfamily II helicase) [Candidatus Latescibacterota bacterium]|jgi:transcription-repair coupling factor (superfamily II helicase)
MSVQRLYNRMKHSPPFEELAKRLASDDQRVVMRGGAGSLTAFALAWIEETSPGPVVVVCADEDRAEALRNDLERLMEADLVGYFPNWDVAHFDGRSPHLDTVGLRIEALDQLHRAQGGIVVVPIAALMGHTLTPELFELCLLTVRVNQEISPRDMADHLVEIGYERVTTVEGVGQFSMRGGILDCCSFGSENPFRIEFWGDEISSIRSFDLSTQRSVEQREEARVLPCRESVLPLTMNEEYIANLEKSEKTLGISLPNMRSVLEREGIFEGQEHYLGVLYGERTGMLDHVPEGCLIVLDDPDGVAGAADEAWGACQKSEGRKEKRRNEPEPLPTEGVLREPGEMLQNLETISRVWNRSLGGVSEGAVDLGGVGGRHYEGHLDVLREDLRKYWMQDFEVVVLCESAGQQARLEEILDTESDVVSMYVGPLQSGFVCGASKVFVVNDHEIFSRVNRKRRYRRFKDAVPIQAITALQKGDFVVHVDHGVGRFGGIERIEMGRFLSDCLALSYRGGDRVFVPVDQMDRVQKYSSQEGAAPVLSKLGTATWERLKEKTKKEIFKMASELVGLYAERKARPGIAFSPDIPEMTTLEASFPFQETRDQLKAIEDVKEDMERATAMDRLICGDVGYGKTEVAIRAAFKAIMDGKQVAILAPTTILAQQHYRTFSERFSEFAIQVSVLSRFRTRAEQLKTIAGVKAGTIDLLVGTHRMLSKDVEFKDLGLLVVDEEHRFGVKNKERLKEMRRLVDVLTLTATPIPRTLHMSLMGARDMSVIQTPPKDRLPIQTEVLAFEEERIAEAILREIDRGGQVYFVHNRIQSMPAMVEFLERLVPEVRFGVGHGQMPERQLEKVMMDFFEHKYDVLVSTMIVESGLDIPNVNTLIVNRADRLGLAQLYQLRGRVGRSNKRAYAHLFVPSRKGLGKPAVRRLRAIEEFSDLGSGFNISMRDMEIRGTGNLLGAQQHGHISAVGFDLYTRLLDEAVRQIKGEDSEPAIEPDIQVSVSSYIPDEYIPDADQKMQFYQRLGDIRRSVDVLAIEEELTDRFGPIPEPTTALLDTIQVKLYARQMRLIQVQVGQTMTLTFSPERVLERKDIEAMVTQSPLPLQFALGDQPRIEVELTGKGAQERLLCAKNVLQCLV